MDAAVNTERPPAEAVGEMLRSVRLHGPHDPRVLEAMARVPRHRFMPSPRRGAAYEDRAVEIGYGQTISAPHMVAIMCTVLDVKPGMRVLEVGTGSGYHAAVLAELVGPEGHVTTVEVLPKLAYAAREALDACGHWNVEVRVGDGAEGARDRAPFDRISVAAASPDIPGPLREQLAVGGRMVIPVGRRECELIAVERTAAGYRRTSHGACLFVPLRGPGHSA